jgi:ATP-binding protein involved in chromosome partitioning
LDADLNGLSLARALGVRGQRLRLDEGAVRPAAGVADIRVMSLDLLMGAEGAPLTWDHPGGLAADTYAWRGMLEASALRELAADTAWGELDVLVLDLPPGTDRFDAVARILPRLDAVVMVTVPSAMSLLVVRRAIHAVREAGCPIAGLVENMAGLRCGQCGALTPLWGSTEGTGAMAAELGVPLWGRVPFDPDLAEAGDSGRPLVLTHPQAEASRVFASIAADLRAFLAAGA